MIEQRPSTELEMDLVADYIGNLYQKMNDV